MVSRSLLDAALLLSVLGGCGKASTSTIAPSATSSATAASSTASASAAASASAGGKLTPQRLIALNPQINSFSEPADVAIARFSAELGPPTQTTKRRVSWGAVDDAQCAGFVLERSENTITGAVGVRAVARKDFHEQWGKICLFEAGLTPERAPFTGKTWTVADFVAATAKHDEHGPSGEVRVEGPFLMSVPEASSAATIHLGKDDPKERVDCTLELGAPLPDFKPGDPLVVEGRYDGVANYLEGCFLLKP